ncbi:MAG: hypothetical protein QW839_00265 [Conexivisphaerales archaeon]
MDFRQTEIFGGIWGARIPSYTQICRRQKGLKVQLGVKYDKDNPVDIAVDSSRYSTGVNGSGRSEEGMGKVAHFM